MAVRVRRRCGLHMGAFGPRPYPHFPGDTHMQAAPYASWSTIDYSLLDATDLDVFVDAPGTVTSAASWSKDKEKAFWGTDALSVHAFLRIHPHAVPDETHGRWRFAEISLRRRATGTPRSAALINVLETQDNLDFRNGVILLSQILNYDLSTGRAEINAGIDLPYILRPLPTYAATASYHHPESSPDEFASAGTVAAGSRSLRRSAVWCAIICRRWAKAREPEPPARRDEIAEKLLQLYGAVGRLHHEGRSAHRHGGEFEKRPAGRVHRRRRRAGLDQRFSRDAGRSIP